VNLLFFLPLLGIGRSERGGLFVETCQEASAIFRRKAIYETIHPETKHGGDRKSDQVANSATRSDRFTSATSEATGKSERTIRRAAARGEALGSDLDQFSKKGRFQAYLEPPQLKMDFKTGLSCSAAIAVS